MRNARWMLCRDCNPVIVIGFTPLKEICLNRATPELMELTARLGKCWPYRQAARVLAEFLPVESTETHPTGRKRTIGAFSKRFPPSTRTLRAVKWRLWHGPVDRAIRDLERFLATLKDWQGESPFPMVRLHSLGSQLLTHVHSNRGAIVNYGKRYRAGLRLASTLAESAVNSLVDKRMVKKQQMRWSFQRAHILMQVRTADLSGELRDRLRAQFRQPEPKVPSLFKRKPPLLRAA
ncbi:hypothetical protein [Mesorhizobium sp. M0998]|uniref:hypothetical protein n=1 Tax=Mesorhizobium sp. M0998 TaxID=2957044 RepID=UPI0033366D32